MSDDRAGRKEMNDRIDSAAIGVLLVWAGICLFADLGWGVAWIGVGVVLFAEQVVRRRQAVDFDWFWVGASFVACLSGVALLYGLKVSVVPIVFILVGFSLIASSVKTKMVARRGNG